MQIYLEIDFNFFFIIYFNFVTTANFGYLESGVFQEVTAYLYFLSVSFFRYSLLTVSIKSIYVISEIHSNIFSYSGICPIDLAIGTLTHLRADF